MPLDDQCLLYFSGTGENRTHIVRFKRPMHYLVCHNPKLCCRCFVSVGATRRLLNFLLAHLHSGLIIWLNQSRRWMIVNRCSMWFVPFGSPRRSQCEPWSRRGRCLSCQVVTSISGDRNVQVGLDSGPNSGGIGVRQSKTRSHAFGLLLSVASRLRRLHS